MRGDSNYIRINEKNVRGQRKLFPDNLTREIYSTSTGRGRFNKLNSLNITQDMGKSGFRGQSPMF